jgi:hypothetical protein
MKPTHVSNFLPEAGHVSQEYYREIEDAAQRWSASDEDEPWPLTPVSQISALSNLKKLVGPCKQLMLKWDETCISRCERGARLGSPVDGGFGGLSRIGLASGFSAVRRLHLRLV